MRQLESTDTSRVVGLRKRVQNFALAPSLKHAGARREEDKGLLGRASRGTSTYRRCPKGTTVLLELKMSR